MEENLVTTNKIKETKELTPGMVFIVLVVVILIYIYRGVNGWVVEGDRLQFYKQGSKMVGMQSVMDEEQSKVFIFDQAGTMKPGWIVYNGHYYYQDQENGIYTGDHVINDIIYHFEEDGVFHGGLYIQDGESYVRNKYGFSKEGLVSIEDRIYCSDVDGRIIYGWKDINGKKRYFDKVTGQMLVDGVYIIDGAGYGFDKNGIMITGWHQYEDGDRFFNVSTGQMLKGEKKINGAKYFFEEDGAAFTGYRTVDNKTYFYSPDNNALYTGWIQDGEDYYYYDEDGVRAIGLCKIEDKTYFFDEEGKMFTGWKGDHFFTDEGVMATGFIEQNGKIFYFNEEGIRWTEAGWQTINNKRYLFDNNGLITDTADVITIKQTVYKVKNGGATATGGTGGGVTAANLDAYLLDIMSKYGSDPQSIFNYCRQFPYKYRAKADVNTMACRILNYKNGACWDYAALCYKMLRLAGYNCQIVVGRGAIYSEHNWVLIEIAPGVWRHMDPERKNYYIYMLTDAQLEAYDGIARSVRYQWNHGAYPAAQ